MKTARFSNVVKKSGKPEVYILLSKGDREFKKVLKSNRIMSLLGGVQGSKSEYGVVGYDEKQRGQLLLFPKSLTPFMDCHIVGIKYDLLSETKEETPSKRIAPAKSAAPAKKLPKTIKATSPKEKPSKTAKAQARKVIPFPKQEKPDKDKSDSIHEIKDYVRKALRALEKNNAVAAYNLLKRIVPLILAAVPLLAT